VVFSANHSLLLDILDATESDIVLGVIGNAEQVAVSHRIIPVLEKRPALRRCNDRRCWRSTPYVAGHIRDAVRAVPFRMIQLAQ